MAEIQHWHASRRGFTFPVAYATQERAQERADWHQLNPSKGHRPKVWSAVPCYNPNCTTSKDAPPQT
jgi:hypothetical protein